MTCQTMDGPGMADRARPAAVSPRVEVDARAAFLSPAEAAGLETEWRDLAAASLERNPFYSPWMLIPALRLLPSESVEIACVFDGESGGRRLLALAPVVPVKAYGRLPLRHLQTWMHPHCFFAAPLIRRGAEQAALRTLFAAIESHASRPSFLRLRHLGADGPVASAARDAAMETGRAAHASGAYQRALLEGGYGAEDYIARVIRKKKRKELNRLKNRLDDEGGAEFRALRQRSELDAWCTDFLGLEHAGWKGREKTSLAASPAEARFFREALAGAFDAGALEFYRLDKAGAPIAMIVNFIEGGEGYSFKIAYDETHARFSPGVMIELEMLKALEGYEALKFVDSCARKDHSMINSLWAERRNIAALNVSAPGIAGRGLLSGLKTLEEAAAYLRALREARRKEAGDDL